MTPADRTSRRVSAAVGALWSAPTWRATGNALAAAGVAAVGGILPSAGRGRTRLCWLSRQG